MSKSAMGDDGRARAQKKLDDPTLFQRDPATFQKAAGALAAAQAELASAEEEWLTLEMLREEMDARRAGRGLWARCG